MANASRKHVGKGAQEKRDGGGAMTDTPAGTVGDSEILSNRDKAFHSKERGQDSKWIESEQRRPGRDDKA